MKIRRILKHKNKLFILMLTLISALTLFLNIGKTYAYSIDENGNIVSDNLFNSQTKETNVITFEFNGSELTLMGSYSGSSDLYYGYNLLSDLELNQAYSISFTTNNTNIFYDAWINGSHYYVDYDTPMIINNLTSTIKNADWRFVLPHGDYNYVSIKIMINKGTTPLAYEPYGMTWIKETLVAQQSNISISLIDTQVKSFLSSEVPSKTLSQLRNDTPYMTSNYIASNISYYSMEKNNPNLYDLIFNGSSSIQGYRYLLNFYDFAVPLNVDNLIFNRGDSTGNLYITLYFVGGDSTQLVLDEGSDNNRLSVSWSNTNDLQIEAISTTAHLGYNAVSTWTMSNSSVIYQDGYYNGYYEGYGEGYGDGLQANQEDSYNYGYNLGYNRGLNSNVETDGFRVLFNSILSYPVNMIKSVFNFNFMGINVASIILFLVSIGIVIFVIKKFK